MEKSVQKWQLCALDSVSKTCDTKPGSILPRGKNSKISSPGFSENQPRCSPDLHSWSQSSPLLSSLRLSDRHSRNVRNTSRAAKVTAEFPLPKFLLLDATTARNNSQQPAADRTERFKRLEQTDTGAAPSVRSRRRRGRENCARKLPLACECGTRCGQSPPESTSRESPPAGRERVHQQRIQHWCFWVICSW